MERLETTTPPQEEEKCHEDRKVIIGEYLRESQGSFTQIEVVGQEKGLQG